MFSGDEGHRRPKAGRFQRRGRAGEPVANNEDVCFHSSTWLPRFAGKVAREARRMGSEARRMGGWDHSSTIR